MVVIGSVTDGIVDVKEVDEVVEKAVEEEGEVNKGDGESDNLSTARKQEWLSVLFLSHKLVCGIAILSDGH